MIKGYTRYSQAYKQTAVITADQGRLIVMLYDGAIKFLTIAIEKLETGDAYGANSNLIKGKSIVAELLASLNMEQGGDIALNLQRLYTYIFNELIDANLNKDVARVQRVIELLKELREGWKTIPAAGKTAPAPGDSPGSIKRIHVQG